MFKNNPFLEAFKLGSTMFVLPKIAEAVYDNVDRDITGTTLVKFEYKGELYEVEVDDLFRIAFFALEGLLLLQMLNIIRKSRLT